MGMLSFSIAVVNKVEIGLDQKLSMPDVSLLVGNRVVIFSIFVEAFISDVHFVGMFATLPNMKCIIGLACIPVLIYSYNLSLESVYLGLIRAGLLYELDRVSPHWSSSVLCGRGRSQLQ